MGPAVARRSWPAAERAQLRPRSSGVPPVLSREGEARGSLQGTTALFEVEHRSSAIGTQGDTPGTSGGEIVAHIQTLRESREQIRSELPEWEPPSSSGLDRSLTGKIAEMD